MNFKSVAIVVGIAAVVVVIAVVIAVVVTGGDGGVDNPPCQKVTGKTSPNNDCSGTECGTWKPSGRNEECGFRVLFTNVVGGRIAQLGSYTYMALLGYQEDGQIVYNCTGSLVNRRYILTAAHCVQAIPQ